MPDGKIYFIINYTFENSEQREMLIIQLSKRDWKLEYRFQSSKYCFMKGAVTGGVDGKIYISGSSVGKTKAVAMIDTKGTNIVIKQMPELNFSRHSHSMTVMN